jgi:glycosyltransferase involved in cell wall biosynthesis
MNHSVILTVHNKEFLIEKVIDSIFNNTINNYELIIILDGCSDKSEEIVLQKIKQKNNCKVLYADNVFETKANNIGLKEAENKYCFLIQDDMIIDEIAWDARMLKPFQINNVFGVTANTSHNWIYNPNNICEIAETDNWSDILIHVDHANKKNINRNTFAIRDCINRGPVVFRKDILEQLNYLDEQFYPLDMDDHDLCYRSKDLDMIVGCYWINYISDINWGGTRINGQPAKWHLEANRKNTKIVWQRHKDKILNNRTIKDIICK